MEFRQARGLINTSAWPYSQADLEAAQHIHELPQRNDITVNIDLGQRGVGGSMPAALMLLKEYTMPGRKQYQYSYTILPVR
jgi:beta-galactosidase